jgi:phosphoenolpyruvate carboxykinase (ATP)
MVKAALKGELKDVAFTEHPIFKVLVPEECPGVPSEILNPENTWVSKEEYKAKARELTIKFKNNFKKFLSVPQDILEAGPDENYFIDKEQIAVGK